MMVDSNIMDCEDVRIGNWNSRLPSDICSNQEIFEEIFSLETWNNILKPEQRDRILKLLPPEVSSNAEAASQTVEDLLNGSLTTFSRNPLQGFFEKLKQGQYDPEVMDMKSNIMTEWKKESLRQLKSYHAKLLEDIVVSRQKFLNRIKGRSTGCSSAPNSFKNRKQDRYITPSVQTTDTASVKVSSVKRTTNTEFNTVVKRPAEPIKTGSRKRLLTEPSPIVVGTANEHPVPKLAKTSSDLTPTKQSKLSSVHSHALVSSKVDDPFMDSASSCVYLLKPKESTTIMTQCELPKPQPTGSTIPDSISSLGNSAEDSKKPPLSYDLSIQTTNSPILASQLQGSSKVSVFQSKTTDFDEPDSSRITLNYYNKVEDKSSEDDLETSSDEFEAIEPTIGFGVNIPSSNPVVTESPKEAVLSRNINLANNRPQNPPTTQTVLINNTPTGLVTLGPNYFNTKGPYRSVLIVNSNGSQSQITTTSNTIPTETRSNNFNSNSFDTKLLKLPISQMNTDKGKGTIVKKGSCFSSSPKLEAVSNTDHPTISCLSDANLKPTVKCETKCSEERSDMKVEIPVTTTITQPTTYNMMTHKKLGFTQSCLPTINPSFRLTVLPSDISPPKPLLSSTPEKQVVYSPSVNESDTSLNFGQSDLNLDLSALSSNESGINLNLSGLGGSSDHIDDSESCISMKMEIDIPEKIDDLSVLDGNPFDSIPNLSDELDGLDLDLVDGLCDFEVLLSEEKKYPSFFCLIRDVLCSTKDHRMNLLCMEKTISKWCASSGAALNAWTHGVHDWNIALVTALNFLAGSYQDVHPEDFVPYIEYKYKTKYYQWIGAGRDSDNNLTSLCMVWMDNLDRLPSIKKVEGETEDQDDDDEENEDSEIAGEDSKKKNKRPQTPPPPRFVTDWSVRQSTEDEKTVFRKQERSRFENPHKAFTYKMHGYESVVGPVKGVYSSQVGMTNKARGHSLLVDERPPYVTILALVRDAVARLPNGEGTRSDICEMLRDSAFLAPDASNVTLNSVVSGALDRLHYERDPCVRYDSHKKSWIYLHRDRTQDQFERLHHNRSYTKSTKCRNTGSRKPRKGISKLPQTTTSPSSTSTSTSASISSYLNTAMASVTSPSKADLDRPFAKSINDSSDTLKVGSESTVIKSDPELEIKSLTATTDPLQSNAGNIMNQSTGVSSLVNINSSTAIKQELSVPINVAKPFMNTSSVKGPTQQIVIQTNDIPIGSIQAPNSVQIRTIRPISVHNAPSTSVYCTPLTSHTLTTSSPTSTLTQGPFLLSPSTFRFPNNLRMSTFRGGPGALNRLPQHRILLTRGSVPMSSQTQGVLLGQTSCGQTVILSTSASGAISGLQAIGSISARQFNDISQRTVYTSSANPISIASTTPSTFNTQNIRLTCSKSVGQTTTHSKHMTLLQTKMLGVGSTAPTLLTNTNPIETHQSNLSSTTIHPSSFSTDSQIINSICRTGVSETVSYSLSKPSISLASAIPVPCSVVQHSQNKISQLYDGSGDLNRSGQLSQTPMTSPIIIRSTQGEFVIPGHISLSRGVQGIKLVPLSMGSKTMLAKIIPNNSQGPSLSSITSIAPVNHDTSADVAGTDRVIPPRQ